MKKLLFIQVVLIPFLISFQSVAAQRAYSLQMFPGAAHCFKTPLTIRQTGYPDLKITADYATESLKLPIYYAIKMGTLKENRGWELEMIHLKIYLQNNPPEVQQFQVSHGFNIVQVNRTWELDRILIRTGAGIVIAHPENIVRGMKLEDGGIFDSGYFIAGPCIQFSAEKRIPLWRNIYLSMEAKTTAAATKIRVYNGHALAPHAGLHILLGIGYRFGGSSGPPQ